MDRPQMRKLLTYVISAIFFAAGIIVICAGEGQSQRTLASLTTSPQDPSLTINERRRLTETMGRIAYNSRMAGRIGGGATMAMGVPWFFYRRRKD
jgi:hypothetical protein